MKILKHLAISQSVTAGTSLKRIARLNEFDNGRVLHGDWKRMSSAEAEAQAQRLSATHPTDVYYVAYDDVMDPSSDYSYKYGRRVKVDNRAELSRMSEDEVAAIECSEEVEDTDIEDIEQEFTSRDTAINGPQGKLPAIFKLISIPEGALVLDYGGGKPEAEAIAQAYLDQFNATEALYDPFNQTPAHNKEVVKLCKSNGGADIAVCSNVLNVIKERDVRINVLNNIRKLVSPSGTVYITVYEGSGSGQGSATQKNTSYQNNRKTASYLEEVQEVFPDAKKKGKLIVAHPASSSVTSAQHISSISDLKSEIYEAAKQVMLSDDFGFPEEELSDVLYVEIKPVDDGIIVEVRAEVSYEGQRKLGLALDPIIQKYDADAYFDDADAGILEAYVQSDALLPEPVEAARDWDVPDAPLDPPESNVQYTPAADETESIEITLSDVEVEVYDDSEDGVGSWGFIDEECPWADENSEEDRFSEIYPELLLTDSYHIIEYCEELLTPYIPTVPGVYKISCNISLVFDIVGVESAITDYWESEKYGSDYDEEIYTDNAEAQMNYHSSSVQNFTATSI